MSIAHIVATKICPNCEKEFFIYDKYRQQKFCSRKCTNNGINSARWKGGRYVDSQGYIHIKNRNHPNADNQGYILEHRLIMEQKLGRFLLASEGVHHLDYNKQNNNPNNLELHNSSSHRTKHNLENNPFKGKKHTEEYKKKRSEFFKEYWRINSKQVSIVCDFCGKQFRRPQCWLRNKNYFCSLKHCYEFRKGGRFISI